MTSIGADPPEVLQAYAVEGKMRERRFSRNWFVFTLALVAVLGLIIYSGMTSAHARGASCFRHGVPAVCRSPAVEWQAQAIVLRQCRRCDRGKVADAIYSFQMNRGPYQSAAELARDVLSQVKP